MRAGLLPGPAQRRRQAETRQARARLLLRRQSPEHLLRLTEGRVDSRSEVLGRIRVVNEVALGHRADPLKDDEGLPNVEVRALALGAVGPRILPVELEHGLVLPEPSRAPERGLVPGRVRREALSAIPHNFRILGNSSVMTCSLTQDPELCYA